LSLYWLVGGIVAYLQQSVALREDEEDMEKLADTPAVRDVSKIAEAEIVSQPQTETPARKQKSKKTSRKKSAKKRRK
jgi:hypothetical protein